MTEYYPNKNHKMKATIKELKDYYNSIPDNIEINTHTRKMINRAIELQGAKEEITVKSVPDMLITFLNAFIIPRHKQLLERKIFYTKKLLNLVSDFNLPDFFKDLDNGLDYAINKWDVEPVQSLAQGYENEPKGAIILAKKRRKPP